MASRRDLGSIPMSELQAVMDRVAASTSRVYPKPFLYIMCREGLISRETKRTLQKFLGGSMAPQEAMSQLRRIVDAEGVC